MQAYSVEVTQTIDANQTRVTNQLRVTYNVSITLTTPLVETLFWSDAYFLSDRSAFDSQVSRRLGETSHRIVASTTTTGVFQHTVSVDKSIELVDPPLANEPTLLYGSLYFYTFVDESQLNEKVPLFAFPELKRFTLTKIVPTLNLTRFDASNSDSSSYPLSDTGYLVPVEFSIKNLGPLKLSSRPKFGIYMKSSSSSASSRIKLDQVQLENLLQVNEVEDVAVKVEIPKAYFGRIQLWIESDELSSTLKFQSMKTQVVVATIAQPTASDLAVTELAFTKSLEAYVNKTSSCNANLLVVNVTYAVENVGVSMTSGAVWTDQIEIVCNKAPVGSNANRLAYRSVSQSRQLRTKQKYWASSEFVFDSVMFGDNKKDCQAWVTANSDGRLFEFDRSNNRKSECCFDVAKKPEAQLESQIIEPSVSPLTLNSTGFLAIKYLYKNRGNGTTPFVNAWYDKFYLFNQSSTTLGKKNALVNSYLIKSLLKLGKKGR